MIDLGKKKLFLFDLDGVLTKGKERPVKVGGVEVVRRIRARKKKLLVLTNTSTDTNETIHSRLRKVGIPIRLDEIITSSRLTAEYIHRKYGKTTYFLLGEKGLDEELRRQGLKRATGPKARVVVVGLDRRLTYAKLDKAVKVVRNGADLVATQDSAMYMSGTGPAVAVGPILKAIEYASGRKGVAIGKPSPIMFESALAKAGCKAEDAVMIGDQEDTDIVGATGAGIDSILVLSGMEDGNALTGAKAKIANVDDLASWI
jgi:HAD superfamily hydrolase (TIGR01450 family)